MKTLLSLILMTVALVSSQPALAQVTAIPPGEWRLAGARRSTPNGPARVKEVTGVLVADPERRQIRFETMGQALYVVPFDRITVMHYEETKYPRRFLGRPSFYLTVHYSDDAGRPAFEAIRLVSEPDAVSALATLERDTGRAFDRSGATESFLGIPIRATIGARVVITDEAGTTTKGAITQLSTSSLTLDVSTGVSRDFDATSIRRIRLAYSPRHVALGAFAGGALFGALMGGLSTAAFGGSGGEVLGATAAFAGLVGGVCALGAVAIGKTHYPFNGAFDVYRGDARSPIGSSAITVAPLIAEARKGVLVSVRW